LPARVAIAVSAGGCRGVGAVNRAVPAIALTGKELNGTETLNDAIRSVPSIPTDLFHDHETE
jgi:pectin methylesterase-like acyl-CoA thioesterase